MCECVCVCVLSVDLCTWHFCGNKASAWADLAMAPIWSTNITDNDTRTRDVQQFERCNCGRTWDASACAGVNKVLVYTTGTRHSAKRHSPSEQLNVLYLIVNLT